VDTQQGEFEKRRLTRNKTREKSKLLRSAKDEYSYNKPEHNDPKVGWKEGYSRDFHVQVQGCMYTQDGGR